MILLRTQHCPRLIRLAGAVALVCAALTASAEADPGATIFEQKCARCHGADGQGTVDEVDRPLFGDLEIRELADVIERTMPEDDPESCVGEEARLVAEYIHGAFYSAQARQARGLAGAPRIDLQRLTVEQYRNAVADLLGQFTPPPNQERRGARRRNRDREGETREEAAAPMSPRPGLRAEYFQSKGMNKADQLREERIDQKIDFRFEEFSPIEGITADQFAIVWSGSLMATETGYYEFRVRTPNGARLYLNLDRMDERRKLRDDSDVAGQSALIDAWVGSGESREESARVFLLGGRQYPIRLEFFKYLEKSAAIQLEWKPPRGTWALLDQRNLNSATVPRVYVVDTPFPPDDRSIGYERGTSISPEWQAAIASAAVAAAEEVVNRLPLLSGVENDAPERESAIKDFLARFARVGFRRPLTNEERVALCDFSFQDAPNPEAAVRRAVIFILTSPYFLYDELTTPDESPDQHTIASRLALTLWDSIPDEALFDAADAGELATQEQVFAQAERMLADPRAKAKMRGFFRHWLELDERELAKDREKFPEFDESVIADLRYSLDLFLDRVVWGATSDYRELLLADYLYLDPTLSAIYQLPGEEQPAADVAGDGIASEFRQTHFPPAQRAGLLTHPYLLSAFSYHDNSSPIHRGVFLTRNIVGRRLRPPPVAVAFKNEEFPPELSMREKIERLTRDSACMSCHSVINPLGFALENFDAIGRWRSDEGRSTIDTRAEYPTDEGSEIEVANARDIAEFAVASEAAHRAFITQLFHHLVKQDPSAYGARTINELRSRFEEDNFNIQRLMIRIAVLAARHGPANAPEPGAES